MGRVKIFDFRHDMLPIHTQITAAEPRPVKPEMTMTLKIRTIDHAVVMASDMERSISFYCGTLGGTPRYLEHFRSGKIPVPLMQLGGAVINL